MLLHLVAVKVGDRAAGTAGGVGCCHNRPVTSPWDLAELAGRGIGELLRRGRSLATMAAVTATIAGVFCLVAVGANTSGATRTAWIVLGVTVCAVPAGAAFLARLILERARRRTGLVADVRRLLDDPSARGAVAGFAGGRRRLLGSGRRLWALRRAVTDRRFELTDLWVTLLALTRLPLLAGIALIGSLVLAMVGVLAGAVAIIG